MLLTVQMLMLHVLPRCFQFNSWSNSPFLCSDCSAVQVWQNETYTCHFYRSDALPVAQPTVSRARKGKQNSFCGIIFQLLPDVWPSLQTSTYAPCTLNCGITHDGHHQGTETVSDRPSHNYRGYARCGLAFRKWKPAFDVLQ